MFFKVVIVGTSGAGKSTYLNKLTTGKLTRNPLDLNKTVIRSLCFDTNQGPEVKFEAWDLQGMNSLESDLVDASAVFVIYDVTSEDPSIDVNRWITKLRETTEIPIIICGNLVDPYGIQFSDKIENCYHLLIWTEANLNLEGPFSWIARQITGDSELKFIPGSRRNLDNSKKDHKEKPKQNKLEETTDKLLDAIHDYIDARPSETPYGSSMEMIRMILEICGK